MFRDPMLYVTIISALVVVLVVAHFARDLKRAVILSIGHVVVEFEKQLGEARTAVRALDENQGNRQQRLVEFLEALTRQKSKGCVLVLGRTLKPSAKAEPPAADGEPFALTQELEGGDWFIAGARVEVTASLFKSREHGAYEPGEFVAIRPWRALEAGALVICVGNVELAAVFVGADAQTPWTQDAGMPLARINQRVYPGSEIRVQVRAT